MASHAPTPRRCRPSAGGAGSPVAGDGRQDREGTQDDGTRHRHGRGESSSVSGVDPEIMSEDQREVMCPAARVALARENTRNTASQRRSRRRRRAQEESQGDHRPHAPADGVMMHHRPESDAGRVELDQVGRDGVGGVSGGSDGYEGDDRRDVGGRGRQAE